MTSDSSGGVGSRADDLEGSASVSAVIRRATVERAVKEWTRQLADLSGRNGLLYYRELKVGTLNLSASEPAALLRLVGGAKVRLSDLFPFDADLRDAARRARAVSAKAKENLEERGVDTLHLVRGVATWVPETGTAATPAAPVLLSGLLLTPRGAAGEDFDLQADGDVVVNPTLQHALDEQFSAEFELPEVDLPIALHEQAKLARLGALATSIPGCRIDDRCLIGNFTYMKLPMVTDLEANVDALTANDLVAAIAGNADAQTAIQARQVDVADGDTDEIPILEEHLILDADSSQQAAIQAVLAGSDRVIQGPPGTGKSQTIANLIATLASSGKRVLFVAEKRAAIDAVVGRLNKAGLDDLVLDLHGGVSSRRKLAENLGDALAAAHDTAPIDVAELAADLERRRGVLRGYAKAINDLRAPWGVSLYEAQARSIGRRTLAPPVHLSASTIDALTPARLSELKVALRELVGLGGTRLRQESNPWLGAREVNQVDVESISDTVSDLARDTLQRLDTESRAAAAWLGASTPGMLAEIRDRIELLEEVARLRAALGEKGCAASPDLAAPLSPGLRGPVGRFFARLTSGAYRAAQTRARELIGPTDLSDHDVASSMAAGSQAIDALRGLGVTEPVLDSAPNLPTLAEVSARATLELQGLARWIDIAVTEDAPLGELRRAADRLADDLSTLRKLPTLRSRWAELTDAGLSDFLRRAEAAVLDEEAAVAALDEAWATSIVDRVRARDPIVGSLDIAHQGYEVDAYGRQDRDHIAKERRRVKRTWAEQVVAARNRWPDQNLLITSQAQRKRGHLPVRDLFARSSDLLLSIKPCWAMSPLLVSQILPGGRPYFDVVIFDEASQVLPADAIPALLRGRRAVIAGDELQLPPSAFFVSQTADDQDEEENPDEQGEALTTGYPSVLNVVASLIKSVPLRWHYRSRDERLIAFSNLKIYRPKHRELITFPGVGIDDPIRYVGVPRGAALADTESSMAEVEAVVCLVLEHATQRPEESLGVIAMGIKHADRVSEALRLARRSRGDLDDFFADSREEPFFVKNLERVQGDERDALVLTVGYGPGPDGRIRYHFGPLNQQGGERRLNVAVTRAKIRMTVVSSLSSDDFDPARTTAEGVRLLRDYLRYAESGGSDIGEIVPERPELNPFELDVQAALEAEGIRAVPQLGTSRYYLDFALLHPDKPGRYVLAVECDGAMYHSAPNTRERDRLRQQQLEDLGWRFHRIWSPDWLSNRAGEIKRLRAAYDAALADGPAPRPRATSLREAAASGPGTARAATASRGPRPITYSYLSIDFVPERMIDAIVQWIQSDGYLRTEDELVVETMHELGFQRRGKKVVTAIELSIARVDRAKRQ